MLIHANQSAVTESRTVVPGSGRVERAREDKGTQRDSRGWWTHSLPWLWRWFHGCEPMSKITKLCTLDTCNLSCVSYTLKVKVKLLSCVQLFATPGTVAYQAPPSMGFSRQEYLENGRNGLPFPSPQNAVLGCNLKDDQEWWTKNDLGSFPGQRFQHHSNPSLWPNH